MNSNESKVTNWRKAKASGNGSGCVEAGGFANRVYIRDTTDRKAGSIATNAKAWGEFISGVKAGEFDLG